MISFPGRVVLVLIGVMTVSAACSSGPSQAEKRAAMNGQGGQVMPTYYLTPVAMVIIASDADGDAVVSREEFSGFLGRAFTTADADSNGLIQRAEYSEWSVRHLGRRYALPGFLSMDENQNDTISADEFEKRFARVFVLHDTDKDGRITRAELVKLLQRPQMQNRPQGMRPGMGQGGMPPGGGRRPPM